MHIPVFGISGEELSPGTFKGVIFSLNVIYCPRRHVLMFCHGVESLSSGDSYHVERQWASVFVLVETEGYLTVQGWMIAFLFHGSV